MESKKEPKQNDLMMQAVRAAAAVMVPAGVIVPFGGPQSRVPNGWLLCDGRSLKPKDYPALLNAIGTAWGGNGNETFYLPDLRGKFLRGVAYESNYDPEKKERLAARPDLPDINNQGNKGNEVGSLQPDAFEQHTHSYNAKRCEAEGGDGFWGYGFDSNSAGGWQVYNVGHNGGSETRPVNCYVNYIIKT